MRSFVAKTFPLLLFVVLLGIYQSQSQSLAADATVWVQQPDGGKSCEINSGDSLTKGAASLKKAQITILDSHKGNDGKMHAQMCGLPSGTANVYQIRKADLPKAMTLGFEEAKSQ
jgi:hypothetical protein